jgi:DNA polymerase-3 subunit gamma/tau
MSYLVLARKWRPKGFDDIIDQEPIVRVLKNSIDQKKIAHAYIFSGPRGVGKTSTARILAKALNCEHGPTSSPCGSCVSCTSITDGSSVDVMEIDGASNNSVNDIRDLRERVKYVPSGGRYKVYIIDETHMLSDAAFNALLKTLEEPPSHVVFVLATTAPKKIPPTVLSRCQHLPFKRISNRKIKESLKNISDAEKIKISGQAIEMIARASDGSLRDALTLLDQISSFSSDIKESDIKDLLGIADFGVLSQLSVAMIEGKRDEIVKIISELVERGTDIRTFTKELVQFFRDLLIASIVKKPEEILDSGKEESETIKAILLKTSEDQLTLMLSEIMKAEVDVRNASTPRLALEMSLMKTSFLSSLKPLKKAIEHIDSYLKLIPDHETQTPEIQKVEQKPDEHMKELKTLTDEIWQNAIKKMDLPLASKLSKAAHNLDGDKLILTFNGGDSLFVDSITNNTKKIEQIFSQELGRKIEIKIESKKEKPVRKKDLKEKIMADPTIKNVLELFDGRIVDVAPLTENRDKDKGG